MIDKLRRAAKAMSSKAFVSFAALSVGWCVVSAQWASADLRSADRSEAAKSRAEAAASARSASAAIARALDLMARPARMAAASSEVGEALASSPDRLPRSLRRAARELARGSVSMAWFVDTSGQVRACPACDEPAGPVALPSPAARALAAALSGREGQLFVADGQPAARGFYFAAPARRGDSIDGAVVAKIDIATLRPWLAVDGSEACLVDGAGDVALSLDPSNEGRPVFGGSAAGATGVAPMSRPWNEGADPAVSDLRRLGAAEVPSAPALAAAIDGGLRVAAFRPMSAYAAIRAKSRLLFLIAAGGGVAALALGSALLAGYRRVSRSRGELSALIGSMRDAVIAMDRGARIASAHCPEGLDVNGGRGFAVGESASKLLPASAKAPFADAMRRLAGRADPRATESFDFVSVNGLGEPVHAQATLSRVDGVGDDARYLMVLRDISARKIAEESHREQAMLDELTGLPNRRSLGFKMRNALEHARGGPLGALLFIDMDHFKKLNDALGHKAGDEMLREVARRVRAELGPNDVAARVGGDEFVMMLLGLSEDRGEAEAQSLAAAEAVRQSLDIAYELSGRTFHSTPSIGVSILGPETLDEQAALRQADLAMYEAKANGKNAARLFEPAMEERARASADLQEDLARLVDDGDLGTELRLVFQPKLDSGRRFVGAETLVRWRHPRRGEISPAQFIPMAESSGHIIPVGRWVMRETMLAAASWTGALRALGATISFNVSPLQFAQDDFVLSVGDELSVSGADPLTITIEITESMLMSREAEASRKLAELKAMGLRVSLDDFGTGFSSLGYLKNFEVDEIKLDQSFVRDLETDSKSRSIVAALVGLGRSLGISVVVEGIERQGQWELLRGGGIAAGQGYLFGYPTELEDFELLWLDAAHLDRSAPRSTLLLQNSRGISISVTKTKEAT